MVIPHTSVSFTVEYSSNFDLSKGFFMGKMAQIHQISKFKNFKLPESYATFQKVAKNIEGFFFPTFISIM
jgi:hypothetical protein